MHKSYALEGFRTSLGNVSRGARAVLSSRSWIAEGRGGHEWDSPLYAEEIRSYADEVRTMLAGAEYEQNRAITVCRSSPSNTAAVLVGEIRRMNALRSPLLQATQEAGVRDLSDDAEIRRAASIINDALTGYIDQIDAIVKDRSSCPETEEEIRRAREHYAEMSEDAPLPEAFLVMVEHAIPEGALAIRTVPDDIDEAIRLAKEAGCVCHADPEEPSAKLLILMGVAVGAGRTAVIPMTISETLPEHDNLARPQTHEGSLEAAIFVVQYLSKVAAPGVLGALNRDLDLVQEMRATSSPSP